MIFSQKNRTAFMNLNGMTSKISAFFIKAPQRHKGTEVADAEEKVGKWENGKVGEREIVKRHVSPAHLHTCSLSLSLLCASVPLWLSFSVVLGYLIVAQPIWAFEGYASLNTVGWARETLRTAEEDVETNMLLYEYFRLNMVRIGNYQLGVHVQGRLRWSRLDDDEWEGRFYQGYVDWEARKSIHIRAGRQFLPNDVGFWRIDGLRFDLNALAPLAPAIYAGVSAPPWSIDDENEKGVVGLEVGRRMYMGVQTRASLLTLFDRDAFDRVILGGRVDLPGTSIFDVHRDIPRRIQLTARGSLDLLNQEFVSGNVSLFAQPIDLAQIHLAYRRETPLFPADSIFSVFAIEPLEELATGLSVAVTPWLEVYGRYKHQFFDIGSVDRYISGFSILSQREPLLRFQFERLDDGSREYWRTYTALNRSLTKRWQVGFVHYYNNFQLSPVSQVETAYSFQLSTSYLLLNDLRLLLRGEDNINPDFKYNIRVYGSLRLDLRLH